MKQCINEPFGTTRGIFDRVNKYKTFIARCRKCEHYHEEPICKCGTVRTKPECATCNHNSILDLFSGKCGNCYQHHLYPGCFNCGRHRRFSGICVFCGNPPPDSDLKIEPSKPSCVYQNPERNLECEKRNNHNKILENINLGKGNTIPTVYCTNCQKTHTGYLTGCVKNLQNNQEQLKQELHTIKNEH